MASFSQSPDPWVLGCFILQQSFDAKELPKVGLEIVAAAENLKSLEERF